MESACGLVSDFTSCWMCGDAEKVRDCDCDSVAVRMVSGKNWDRKGGNCEGMLVVDIKWLSRLGDARRLDINLRYAGDLPYGAADTFRAVAREKEAGGAFLEMVLNELMIWRRSPPLGGV